jgi:alpha-amylase/alpha-mannosidase (GH57 family)
MNTIRLCLVLHNHQPIGNFDEVFEQAYQDSYLPFLDTFEQYPELRISLHTSGPLIQWLDEHHSDYVDRIAALVAAGRVEIVGGPFYEPILTMIPSRDRVGQISTYTEWLSNRLNAKVQGIWVPERVWEQSLTADLVDAGVEYIVLDDFHFKNAGLSDEQLTGYFVTEDQGRVLRVFPGSEKLRYTIPFAEPQETIEFLREIAERQSGAAVVFGDDGEKFGTWPGTKQHVYEEGWLRRFFDALLENREWIRTSTLADAVVDLPPMGKVYLPDASYREMTEWALPVEQQHEFERVKQSFAQDDRWPSLQRFIRGGFWRNFRVKYPEANEMYSRMMAVSRRCEQARQEGVSGPTFENAVRELYRGQCNCSYWHGAFGGIYLPHLRNAVYERLIAADNLLDKAIGKQGSWVEATVDDYNFDTRQEVRLATNRMIAFVAPASGGQLYELDIRPICLNLMATLARRPEAYHRRVLNGGDSSGHEVASIHDQIVLKQDDLDQRIQYDRNARRSLVDHFYDDDVTLDAIRRSEAEELGDFIDGAFETKLRRSPNRIQVLMTRDGYAGGLPVKVTKGVTLEADSSCLTVAYMIENLPHDRPLHFSVEINLAALPAGAEDRFFYRGTHEEQLGHLGTPLDLDAVQELGLFDDWQGVDIRWSANQLTKLWTYPVETVSQSETGIELVHQSVTLQPHWLIRGDAKGRWSVAMQLVVDTALAEHRMSQQAESGSLV